MSGKPTRIALVTSQDIGFELVEAFSSRSDLELLVITERTLRDEAYGYRSAIDACAAHNIPCVTSSRIDDAVKQRIREFAPAMLVAAYYPHVIPYDTIREAPLGAINVHPGLLPHYRGRFPTPWYILNGEEYFGVAIHLVDGGIDTGDVLVQARFPLSPTITGHDLYRATMREGAALLTANLAGILSGTILPRRQEGTGSYYSAIEKRYQIDWNQPTAVIERRVRVHARPFLPAFTYLLNRMVFINRATPVSVPGYVAQGGGRLIAIDEEDRVAVSCVDGCIRLDEWDVVPPLMSWERPVHLRVGNRFE